MTPLFGRDRADKVASPSSSEKPGERHFFLFALKTFRRLLISFSVPLLLPLLVSSLVYATAVSVIHRELRRANESTLLLMKRTVDSRLNELFVTADQLSINDEMRSVAAARDPVSPLQRLAMLQVQGLLRQCATANTFIDGVYLYLPKSDYVLSNVSRYRGDEFDLIAENRFGVNARSWAAILSASPYRKVEILGAENPSLAGTIVFSQKMVFESSGPSPGILVITIDGRRFRELLESLKWNPDGVSATLTPLCSVFAGGDDNVLDGLPSFGDVGASFRSFELRASGGRFVVGTIGSDVTDWRYAYAVPGDTYLRSVDSVTRIMVFYVLLCVIGGTVVSFFLARREYTPIRRLSQLYLDRLGGSGPGNRGDFSYLEEALQRLLKERETLEVLIREQRESVKNELLRKLLRGNTPRTQVFLQSCGACGIILPSDICMVIAVSLDDHLPKAAAMDLSGTSDSESLVAYMLQPLFDELLGGVAVSYVTETVDGIECLLCLDAATDPAGDMSPAIAESVVQVADRIRALFSERFGVGLSFGISDVHATLSELPLAVAEASEMLEYLALYDRKNMTLFAGALPAEVPRMKKSTSSLALHRLIAEKTYAGDLSAVRENVIHYLDSELPSMDLPLSVAKLRISSIVNIVLESLQEAAPSLDPRLLSDLNPLGRLSSVWSVSELKRQVEELFTELERSLPKYSGSSTNVLKDEVVRYVEENFRDRNLCVASIAETFGVTVPHLSRSFKKLTGIGLLDYIHLVRVQEAKRLIVAGGHSVQEISELVGCGSRVTLARAFKRYEGIAPSAFRDTSEG